MVDRAVVAFTISLHRELPVAFLDQVDLLNNLGVGDVMGRDIGLQGTGHVIDIGGRILGQTDEDQAGDAAHVDFLQTVAGGVEARPHMLGVQ